MKNQKLVALIGRTNVGKSTIFNKLTEKEAAVISRTAGTTRDYKIGDCLWNARQFSLADTAGLDIESQAKIDKKSLEQAAKIIKKANLLLLVVNIHDGLLPQDKKFALLAKKSKKPVIVVANKTDSQKYLKNLPEFYKLGLGDPIPISGLTGSDTDVLLDEIIKILKIRTLKKTQVEEIKKNLIKIALVGKPNVGKSSLFNSIAGEERVIVSELPHTTRDSQDLLITTEVKKEEKNFLFIDTAGIRKRRKIDNYIEKASIRQSLAAIRKSNLVLLLMDISQPVSVQDKHLAKEVLEQNKALIFVANKWDLIEEKETNTNQEYIQYIYRSFPYLTWAPIIFISAKTGFKVKKLLELIIEINNEQTKKIEDKSLERFLKYIVKKQPPRKTKGTKTPYIHSIKQVSINPQTFEIKADGHDNIHFSYQRFIKNQLRKRFGLMGCGIKLICRIKKKRKHVT